MRASAARPRLDGWPEELLGSDLEVPTLHGPARYAYLDNAASTPVLRAAAEAVQDLLPWYSSVHRGAGYKSRLVTNAYEAARDTVSRFVNAPDTHVVVFVKNATEGLNRLADLVRQRRMTVVTSIMEHHANMLPWRSTAAELRTVTADRRGVIDEEQLRAELVRPSAGPKLLAISGAYNVSGYAPPIHHLARLAHEHGAEILVDGAQLVPHRPIDLRGRGPGEAIDYLVFSAHKIYAPFGSGALVAPRQRLEAVAPQLVGGGIVDMVSLDEVVFSPAPAREEAGSPNVLGAVALAAALTRLEQIGRAAIDEQERALTAYAIAALGRVPGLRILGPRLEADRVGVVSFTLGALPHGLVAAVLAYEHGIGIRSGCFCAHPGVLHLLGLPDDEVRAVRARLRQHVHANVPGAARASLGLENTAADIDRLVHALGTLAETGPAARYRVDPATGDYAPEARSDTLLPVAAGAGPCGAPA